MYFLNQKNKEKQTNIFPNFKKEEPKKLIDTKNLINPNKSSEKNSNINLFPDLPQNIQEKEEEIPDYNENPNFQQLKIELNKAANFIDYFVEIGVDQSIYKKGWLYNDNLSLEELNKKEELQPKIISYFPPMEKETISFDESIIKHCFPNGYYLIKSDSNPNYEIFSFILDNNYFNLNYPQKYLSCIIFYESISQYKELYEQYLILNGKEKEIIKKEIKENYEEIYIPKCLLVMSLYPFFNEFENILLKLYEYSLGKINLYGNEILEEENINDNLDNNKNGKIIKYEEDENTDKIIKCKKFGKTFLKKRSKSYNSYDKANNLNVEKNDTITKAKRFARKTNKSIKAYIKSKLTKKDSESDNMLNQFFPNINNLNNDLNESDLSLEEKYSYPCFIPIDKFIENLLIELPVPPRGKTSIEYTLMNKEKKLYQNKMNEIPLISVNLKNLFVKFSIEKIIEIYRYLFLETRVLFFSQNIDILNVFIYGLLSLLYPFEYQYQIITILPKENFEILESITPFIAGINQKYCTDFFDKLNLSLSDCIIIVDLDRCELNYINNENNIPDFPKTNKKQLDKKLNDILTREKYKNITEEKRRMTINLNFKKNNDESINNENNIRKNEMRKSIHNTILNKSYKFNNFTIDYAFNSEISSAFFNFNASLLTDYSNYLDLSFYSSNVPPCLEVLFKVNDFLKEIPSSEKDFYNKFISETQLFGDYLYKRMIPKNSQEKIRVLLFDETIHEYHKPIFSKTHQCVFIKSQDFNFEEKYEILKPREINEIEKNFFAKNKILLLSYGIIIEEGKKIKFKYPIFPKLLTHKFFLNNI